MLQRLKQYIDYKGVNVSSFERSVGMSNASFSKTLKQGKSIGSEKIEKILIFYSDLNPEWLLMGKGEMLRTSISNKENEDAQSLENTIAVLREENVALRATITDLRANITDLRKMLELLRKKKK